MERRFIKTYERKVHKTEKNALKTKTMTPKIVVRKRQPLSTKEAVQLLLQGSLKKKVCRFCLNLSSHLSELDQIMQISGTSALYKVTIKDMLVTIHPFKLVNDPNLPNKICNKCIDRTLSSYLFSQQCERAERAIRNCFDDLYEKFNKLDPLDCSKRRGRKKLHPNHNKLYPEHEKVIDYAEPIINMVNRVSVNSVNNKPLEINRLECLKCCEILPNIESLVNHEKIHPSTMWFNCHYCGQSFPKRHLIKKHIKAEHIMRNELSLPSSNKNDMFTCKDCGNESETYSHHLEHIEKHKFKMALEHLVERKMDRLCAICLQKGSRMTDLDKMVCLHGGFPEISGDKTLYNILASTLPDNTHKYRELFVPAQASIIKIIKKKNSNNEENMFILSKPIVITKCSMDFDEMYLFLFDEPYNSENDNNSNDADKIYIKDSEIQFTSVQHHNMGSDKIYNEHIPEKDKNSKLIFSNPFYEINLDRDVNNESNNKKLLSVINENINRCKKCWIFKKPTCKECFGNARFYNSNDHSIDKDTSGQSIHKDENFETVLNKTDTCTFCWMFKNIEQCYYCKKHNFIEKNISSGDSLKSKVDENTIGVSPTPKRKLQSNEDPPSKAKQMKWYCNICLISNDINRQTCACCESNNPDCIKDVKFYFDKHHEFLKNNEISIDEASSMPISSSADEALKKNFGDPPLTNHEMNFPHNYTATKICDNCLNLSITSYTFLNRTRYVRFRLTNCINLMLDSLSSVSEPSSNLMIEISQNAILDTKYTYDVDELLHESHESDIEETDLPVDVLEDEFRVDSKESDYEDNDMNLNTKKRKQDSLGVEDDFMDILENPARNSIRTYTKTKLVNGYQEHNISNNDCKLNDVCSEFLTFKDKKPVVKKLVKKFTCPFCCKHFISDYCLRRHLVKHYYTHKSKCCKCDKLFPSKFLLNEHKKTVHLLKQTNVNVCKTCGRTFVDENKLKLHLRSHITKRCRLCDKLFVTQLQHDRHIYRHMLNVKVNQEIKRKTCSFCESAFSSDNKLSLHVNKVHLQIKPYACDMCEKSFYVEDNLNNHRRVHSVRNKEVCQLCNRTLKCRRDLVIHIRKHIGDKPYECSLCDQRFYSENKLRIHQKTLHKDRFCKSKNTSKCELKQHVIMNHSEL